MWDDEDAEFTCVESASNDDENIVFDTTVLTTAAEDDDEENSCNAADETVLDAADIVISYPDEVTDREGKTYKREIREKDIAVKGLGGVEHTVIVPLRFDVKVPAGKTVKVSYDVYLANIDRLRGMPPEKVLKQTRISGGTLELTGDATGNAAVASLASKAGIRDVFAGGEGGPPDIAASNRYGVMVVARQMAPDPQGGWTWIIPGSKTYKSIFMIKTNPAPALISDNDILKP